MTRETTDSSSQTKPPESSGWLMDNVVHPFTNAVAIEPWNAVASVTDGITGTNILPKCELSAVPESKGAASWLAQTVSGGIGAIIPYVVVGKATGGLMEGGGRFLESKNLIETGGFVAKGLASERAAMIVGAGLYGGAKDPVGKESRFGNAVGSMVGFGAFEYGNKLASGMSMAESIPLRALVGAVGGSGQLMTSNLISQGDVGSFNSLSRAASSGAALNLLLPVAQHGFGKAIDAANVRLGRPIPVDHFVARENWQNNSELQKLVDQTPLTRVKRADTPTEIDHKSNVVNLGRNDGAPDLGHELSHRITTKAAEPDMKDAAALLRTDPEAAKQKFIEIRSAQEKAAIDAGQRVRSAQETAALDTNRQVIENAMAQSKYAQADPAIIQQMRANPNLTYGDLFKQEAADFERTGGKYRPTKDFEGVSADFKGVNPDTGLLTWQYTEPAPLESTALPADVVKRVNQSTTAIGSDGAPHELPGGISFYERTADMSFQRWLKMDAITDEKGKSWGTIELNDKPVPTPFGTARLTETFPDQSIAFHIVEGNGVPNNVVLRAYTKGLQTDFGLVTSSVTHPDGRVDYGMIDGREAHEYATPNEEWFGKVKIEDTKADGTKFYHLTDGGTVEWYPNPMKVQMSMRDGSVKQVDVSTAWRGNGKATRSMLDRLYDRGSEPVEGQPVDPNSVLHTSEYILADQSTMDHQFLPDRINVRTFDQEYSPLNIVEHHPNGLDTTEGKVNSLVRNFDSIVYNRADGISTQIYDATHRLRTAYGDVSRVDFLPDKFIKYTKDNGNQVLTHPDGLANQYGAFTAREVAPDGTESFYRKNGDIVEVYPRQVTTNLGIIEAVERSASNNTLTLYRPADSTDYHSLQLDFTNKRMTYLDAEGNLIPNGFQKLNDDFMLLRKFSESQYPAGKASTHGPLRSIITDANGVDSYTFATPGDVSRIPITPDAPVQDGQPVIQDNIEGIVEQPASVVQHHSVLDDAVELPQGHHGTTQAAVDDSGFSRGLANGQLYNELDAYGNAGDPDVYGRRNDPGVYGTTTDIDPYGNKLP